MKAPESKARKQSIVAVLPLRAGSERIKNKNTVPFAGVQGGLTRIKIEQLLAVPEIDEVLVDTDDEKVLDLVSNMVLPVAQRSRLRVERRDPWFARSETSTDELIRHVLGKVSHDVMLWTHATSPLVGPAEYSHMIGAFRSRDSRAHDSLMAVTPIHEFLWCAQGPVNYDRKEREWPRTQDLPEWFIVNSAAFIIGVQQARATGRRTGDLPLLFRLDKITGWDVDWPEDFLIAELLYRNRTRT